MVKIIGLAIANGFAALAGSVYCQQKGFFEISTGTGTIVIGLANVIIGTQLFKRFGFVKSTTLLSSAPSSTRPVYPWPCFWGT